MDDAGVVRMSEPIRDPDQDLDLLGQRQRLVRRELVEVLSRQEFADQVEDGALGADVVDRREVAVVEVARQLSLLKKTRTHVFVLGMAGLDRHGALEDRIPRLIDGAESTAPDLPKDLVFAESIAHLRTRPVLPNAACGGEI